LAYRGVSGHCSTYGALGINTAVSNKPGSRVRRDAPEIQTAITIGKPAEELYASWCDPAKLRQIVAPFAEVTTKNDGLMHWRLRGPLNQVVEWDSHVTHEEPGRRLVWESVPGSKLVSRGEVTFRPGPAAVGTEVRLFMKMEPPLGTAGSTLLSVLNRIPRGMADYALRRFKSLIETGEIPTTARQPAARSNAR
jgi:uncharacterized membrane protein